MSASRRFPQSKNKKNISFILLCTCAGQLEAASLRGAASIKQPRRRGRAPPRVGGEGRLEGSHRLEAALVLPRQRHHLHADGQAGRAGRRRLGVGGEGVGEAGRVVLLVVAHRRHRHGTGGEVEVVPQEGVRASLVELGAQPVWEGGHAQPGAHERVEPQLAPPFDELRAKDVPPADSAPVLVHAVPPPGVDQVRHARLSEEVAEGPAQGGAEKCGQAGDAEQEGVHRQQLLPFEAVDEALQPALGREQGDVQQRRLVKLARQRNHLVPRRLERSRRLGHRAAARRARVEEAVRRQQPKPESPSRLARLRLGPACSRARHVRVGHAAARQPRPHHEPQIRHAPAEGPRRRLHGDLARRAVAGPRDRDAAIADAVGGRLEAEDAAKVRRDAD
mmetsp:Transcript_22637/g.64420  ORF Transcript_22637/g.64420 Transcript_22637/m.64420 type:complete len:391 (-) Transcript_22637:797-1969(-)